MLKQKKSKKQFQGKKRNRDEQQGQEQTHNNLRSKNNKKSNPKYKKGGNNWKNKNQDLEKNKLDPNEEFKKQLLGGNNEENEIDTGTKEIKNLKDEIKLIELQHNHIFSALSQPLDDIIKKQRDKYINKNKKYENPDITITPTNPNRIKVNSLLGKKIVDVINRKLSHTLENKHIKENRFQKDLSLFMDKVKILMKDKFQEKKIKFDVNPEILEKIKHSLKKEKKLIEEIEDDIFNDVGDAGHFEKIEISSSNDKLKLTDDKDDIFKSYKDIDLATLLKSFKK